MISVAWHPRVWKCIATATIIEKKHTVPGIDTIRVLRIVAVPAHHTPMPVHRRMLDTFDGMLDTSASLLESFPDVGHFNRLIDAAHWDVHDSVIPLPMIIKNRQQYDEF